MPHNIMIDRSTSMNKWAVLRHWHGKRITNVWNSLPNDSVMFLHHQLNHLQTNLTTLFDGNCENRNQKESCLNFSYTWLRFLHQY